MVRSGIKNFVLPDILLEITKIEKKLTNINLQAEEKVRNEQMLQQYIHMRKFSENVPNLMIDDNLAGSVLAATMLQIPNLKPYFQRHSSLVLALY